MVTSSSTCRPTLPAPRGASISVDGRDVVPDVHAVLDRMAALLRQKNIRRAFIDVSGDCIAIGAPPGQDGWTVDIVDPDHPGRWLTSTRIRDEALATSANTVSIVRYGSFTAGHVMDPADGWPARRLRQATVVAGTAIEADALSTAMLVSGTAPGAGAGVRRVYRV